MKNQNQKLKKFEAQQLPQPAKIKGGAGQGVIVEDHVVFLQSNVITEDGLIL